MEKKLYYGGPVLTMKAENDYAEALVTENGRIAYVGSLEKANELCDESTCKVNLQGHTLMPAFIDPHGHISMVAQFAAFADLSECTDFAQILQKLKAYLQEKKTGPEGILMGFGYDHNFLKEQRHPDKTLLDQVSSQIPIYIMHTSSHMGVGNSAMLALAGIDSSTPDPKGARFGRMPGSMEPDGYAEEAEAIGRMLMTAAPRIKLDMQAQIAAAQETYLKNGITTCQDGAAGAGDVKNFAEAAENGSLVIDVVSYPVMGGDTGELLKKYAAYDKTYQNRFKIGGLKIVLDGSPQGKTAWLTQPYEGEGEYRGYPAKTDEEVYGYAKEAIDRGEQLLAHCNGDAASDQFLDAYEKARMDSQNQDKQELRPVMIHCQTVRDDQLDRMALLGMIPSIFVAHTYYWGDIHLKNLGKERGSRISPARSAFDRGLKVNFHQDPLVVQPKMLHTVWCAVNRITRSEVPIGPQQRVSVYEALEAVTINGAYAYFEEDRKGTLEEGKLADMIILSDNPMTVPSMEIGSIRVLETIKEGVVRWRE